MQGYSDIQASPFSATRTPPTTTGGALVRRRQPQQQPQQQPAPLPAVPRASSVDELLRCGPQTAADFETLYRQREQVERQRWEQSSVGRRWLHSAWWERTVLAALSAVVQWFGRVGGLLVVVLAWAALFFLCEFFWYLMFDRWAVIAPSVSDDSDAKTMLGDMGLIIGIIYYVWFRDALYGYSKAPTTYRTVLDSTSTYCRTLYAFLRAAAVRTETEERAGEHAYYIVQTLTLYSYRLFTDRDRDASASAATSLGPAALGLGRELAREAPSGSPADVVDGLMAMLQLRVRVLERHKRLSGSDTRTLETMMQRMRQALTDARVGYYVVTPLVYRMHITLVMAVYFMVWTPFAFYARIGVASLAIYPIFMLMIWGIFIYSWYLGDAFSSSTAWSNMRLPRWRSDAMRANEQSYTTWLEHVLPTPDEAAILDARRAAAGMYRTPPSDAQPCEPLPVQARPATRDDDVRNRPVAYGLV
jgi:hypothetical protein